MKRTSTATPQSPSVSSRPDSGVHEDVAEAIADAVGVSPHDLQPPLYDAVDPDALDSVVESLSPGYGGTNSSVSFSYDGYEVTVTAAGDVSVADERDD